VGAGLGAVGGLGLLARKGLKMRRPVGKPNVSNTLPTQVKTARDLNREKVLQRRTAIGASSDRVANRQNREQIISKAGGKSNSVSDPWKAPNKYTELDDLISNSSDKKQPLALPSSRMREGGKKAANAARTERRRLMLGMEADDFRKQARQRKSVQTFVKNRNTNAAEKAKALNQNLKDYNNNTAFTEKIYRSNVRSAKDALDYKVKKLRKQGNYSYYLNLIKFMHYSM